MAVLQALLNNSSRVEVKDALERLRSDLITESTSPQLTEKVEVTSRSLAPQINTRLKVNQAIETTNIAIKAVEEINRLVSGIAGIVELAEGQELSSERVEILQKEAEELRQQISVKAKVESPNRTKPLAGDPIRIEVEQTLGKALEVILPKDAVTAFGIGPIRLSPKDVIINTITSVERARKGIQDLREKLDKGLGSLRDALASVEIARENQEASQSSIRDVEDALRKASVARREIKSDPDEAFASVGEIPRAQELLKS